LIFLKKDREGGVKRKQKSNGLTLQRFFFLQKTPGQPHATLAVVLTVDRSGGQCIDLFLKKTMVSF
jgi:hypothetical protein